MKHDFGSYVLIIVSTFALKFSAINCDISLRNNTQGLLAARLGVAVRTNWDRIISPALIQESLFVAVLGSTGSSKTQTELRKASQVAGSNYITEKSMINFYYKSDPINYLYVNMSLKPAKRFMDYTQFTTQTKNVDFTQIDSVAKEINEFLKNGTCNQLKKDQPVVKRADFNKNTAMIALNLVTHLDDFLYPFKAPNKTTGLMQTDGKFLFGRVELLKATAVVLPFKDCSSSMLVIFADEKRNLIPLERRLESVDVTKIPSLLKYVNITLSLRRFEVHTVHSVNTETLKRLGIHEATSRNAKFGNFFNEEKRILLKELRQFSVIKVDMEGVKFASVTKVRYEFIHRNRARTFQYSDNSTQMRDKPKLKFNGINPLFYYIFKDDYVLAAGSSYNGRNIRYKL